MHVHSIFSILLLYISIYFIFFISSYHGYQYMIPSTSAYTKKNKNYNNHYIATIRTSSITITSSKTTNYNNINNHHDYYHNKRLLLRLSSTIKTEPDRDIYSKVKVAVLGGGAFSLALIKVLSYKNISTVLLVRNQTIADHINQYHYHPKYLSDCLLPLNLYVTSNPQIALENANYVIHAVPMQQSRSFLTSMKPYLSTKIPILSVSKGVEQNTFALMNDIISETLGIDQRAAFLSGPSFAREIMNGQATAVVIASEDANLSKELAVMLSSVEFRCHTSRDVKVNNI